MEVCSLYPAAMRAVKERHAHQPANAAWCELDLALQSKLQQQIFKATSACLTSV
jgi:hypothetical protein